MTDYFEEFIRSGKYLKNWSPKTERSYRQAWSSFQLSLPQAEDSHLTGATVTALCPTKAQLEAWVVWMRQKGMSPGGCNCYIRAMNSYLAWLAQEQFVPEKLRIRLLPNPAKPLQGFSDIEIRSLLSFRPKGSTELRTWTLINIILDTGVRIDEVITLLTTNINLDQLIIKVVGKGNKTRLVPFSLELRKVIFRFDQALSKQGTRKDYFFCTHNRTKLSYRNTYRDIKNLCAKAGVSGEHVHPHAFRHAFACTYIRRGGDIYRLSRILGHTSISTTQIYLRSMGIEQVAENHSSLSPLSRYP